MNIRKKAGISYGEIPALICSFSMCELYWVKVSIPSCNQKILISRASHLIMSDFL